MQPVHCLTDIEPTVCARASRSRLYKYDPRLALMYVDVVLTVDTWQTYAKRNLSISAWIRRSANSWQFIRRPANDRGCSGFDSLNCCPNSLTEVTALITCYFLRRRKVCHQIYLMLKNSWSWNKICSNFEQLNCFINWLFYGARHLRLTKWTWNAVFVISFVGKNVLQLQQKSDPAKSGSGRILGVGYPNPVSGKKSISVHPYTQPLTFI